MLGQCGTANVDSQSYSAVIDGCSDSGGSMSVALYSNSDCSTLVGQSVVTKGSCVGNDAQGYDQGSCSGDSWTVRKFASSTCTSNLLLSASGVDKNDCVLLGSQDGQVVLQYVKVACDGSAFVPDEAPPSNAQPAGTFSGTTYVGATCSGTSATLTNAALDTCGRMPLWDKAYGKVSCNGGSATVRAFSDSSCSNQLSASTRQSHAKHTQTRADHRGARSCRHARRTQPRA